MADLDRDGPKACSFQRLQIGGGGRCVGCEMKALNTAHKLALYMNFATGIYIRHQAFLLRQTLHQYTGSAINETLR